MKSIIHHEIKLVANWAIPGVVRFFLPSFAAIFVLATTSLAALATPVFVCNQFCPNLGRCYGIGVLTTQPQYCFNHNATPTGLLVAPLTSTVTPGPTTVYRCLLDSPNLQKTYGGGVLTVQPQYCYNGTVYPTGLSVNAGPAANVPLNSYNVSPLPVTLPFYYRGGEIYACKNFAPSLLNSYGQGVLTTEPSYCFGATGAPLGAGVFTFNSGAVIDTGMWSP
jgi:hypothetical protein